MIIRSIMSLIQNIKSFFIKENYYVLEDFNLDDEDVKFQYPDSEAILNIKKGLDVFIKPVNVIKDDKKTGLLVKNAFTFKGIDNTLIKLKEIILEDYADTKKEAEEQGWNFNYFICDTPLVKNAALISVSITYKDSPQSGIVYNAAAVKKSKDDYYVWNMLE